MIIMMVIVEIIIKENTVIARTDWLTSIDPFTRFLLIDNPPWAINFAFNDHKNYPKLMACRTQRKLPQGFDSSHTSIIYRYTLTGWSAFSAITIFKMGDESARYN